MKYLIALTIGVCLLLTSVPAISDQAEDEAANAHEVDAIDFDPSLYTFMYVTGCGAWAPSINNHGEIVYVAFDSEGYKQVFSTARGQLTDSDTMNLRFTDINDHGEVVYQDHSATASFTVYSTIRGDLAPGPFSWWQSSAPGINNLGEVSFSHTQTDPRGVYSTERGLVVETQPLAHVLTDINDSAEIVYGDYIPPHDWPFWALDHYQIFSSERGQLTTLGGFTATINNFGDVVYTNGPYGGPIYLYSLDGTQLTDFSVGLVIDMNDHGDIVFSVLDRFAGWYDDRGDGASRVILATQTPENYPQYQPFSGFPPPCTPEPPVAQCHNVTVSADDLCQADANVDAGSYAPDGGEVVLSQDPAGPYRLGDTLVTLIVTDEYGVTDSCEATVNVMDDTPPNIESLEANPDILWPPNHKMVPVTVAASASDFCDANPSCQIVSVSSSEPADGTGDGATALDWEITGDLTLNLRAERKGNGSGRLYTITVKCSDSSDNSSTGTTTVFVPHDQRKKK